MTQRRHFPNGSLSDEGHSLNLTQETAGWTYTGLRVLSMDPGETRTFATGQCETALLPLSGGRSKIEVNPEHGSTAFFDLEGRTSVFSRVTDFVYIGRDSTVTVTVPEPSSGGLEGSAGLELALPMARCDNPLEPKYGPAEEVETEARGGGPATRQVTNFLTPDRWSHADKLMCCELITPDGNWSSYPPHKHDDSPECEVNNEEIYYFRIGKAFGPARGAAGTIGYSSKGFGMHRTYTGPRPDLELAGSAPDPLSLFDENVVVRDGDLYLVPRGYHGPCIAAPGYPMYYLNVLAGPGGERSMAFCDDPNHHWVRDTWLNMDLDPRCPVTSADGVVEH